MTLILGPKMTNQVLTGVPFIAFIEEVSLVNDVTTLEPFIIALEITGMCLEPHVTFTCNVLQETSQVITTNYEYTRHIVPMKSRITLLCSVFRLFIGTI